MSCDRVASGTFQSRLPTAAGISAKHAINIQICGRSIARIIPTIATVATQAANTRSFRSANVMIQRSATRHEPLFNSAHGYSTMLRLCSGARRRSWDDNCVPRQRQASQPSPLPAFDVQTFLASAGAARTIRKHSKSQVIFSQGDHASDVFYVQQGSVKLSVLSRTGKEAVVAILRRGDFFGEGCLANQPRRMATAAAMSASTIVVIEKATMLDLLHTQTAFAERFLSHMLSRNIRVEEDLVDLLFNSSEKRLARGLLLLARYGKQDRPLPIPAMSQETLAEMIGTTRSRVNFFMNKFRDLGFIEYSGGDIKVNSSLLTVVLHD